MFLFVGATLSLYSIWFVGAPFASDARRWRQKAFGRWALAFARIANMKIETIGAPPAPPFFMVCNHLSYTDVPALRAAVEAVFVAKGEIEGWFLAGRIVGDMGTVFINRENRRDIPRAGAKIIERLQENEGIIVFPEGTSTKGEDVLPFNSSFLHFAAEAGLPVHYASISYQTAADSAQASEVVCWWRDVSFGAHLWELFKLRGFTAIITFGDAPVQKENRKELAACLRDEVKNHFTPVL